MNERCFAQIDLKALLHNYRQLSRIASPGKVMAVVKADAYGHGSVEVAKHLEQNGCDFFAVASIDEAIELRHGDIRSDILIFGRTHLENAWKLTEFDLIQTIPSVEYATELSNIGLTIRAHINVDTGMSRFGIYMHHHDDLSIVSTKVLQIKNLKNLKVEGLYTHFSDSDNKDQSFTQHQMYLFDLLTKHLKEEGHTFITHAYNSSATIQYPQSPYDYVRCGIALYGYPQIKTNHDFQPVMSVYAYVSDVRNIKKDDSVSYVRRYISHKDMKVATIAIGYADGYLRGNTNKDYFISQGKKLPQIGTVCMDACMVDATNTEIKTGDLVLVFGKEKSASVLAKNCFTIEYEIVCGITKRVTREYVK